MKTLTDYLEKPQSKVFAENGAFFAFSNKQFKKSREPGKTYVRLFSGLICPEENKEQLNKDLDRIVKEARAQNIKENGPQAIIKHAYFNYECQIIMDTETARESLKMYVREYPDLFSDELISKTFKECWNEALDKDLF